MKVRSAPLHVDVTNHCIIKVRDELRSRGKMLLLPLLQPFLHHSDSLFLLQFREWEGTLQVSVQGKVVALPPPIWA